MSIRVLLADLQAIGRLSASETAKLAAIPRPSSERKQIGSFLTTARTEHRLIVEQMIPAAQRGDQAALSRLATKKDKLSAQYNRLAFAVAAGVCAEDPQPSG